MKHAFLLFFIFHLYISLGAQRRISCDSLARIFDKEWDSRFFDKVSNETMIDAFSKCILKEKIELNNNVLSNISSLRVTLRVNFLRRKVCMLLIKIHPLLDPNLKYANEQGLVANLMPKDINFGSQKILKRIKRNFGIDTYFKILTILNIKLKNKDKILLEESFSKVENNGQPEWKTQKWISAIILAKSGDAKAENYLIDVTRRATALKSNRHLIYGLGRDLVLTRNRKIINFIIDDFLMSDYHWSDFDTYYQDYDAAWGLLEMVVDEQGIFYDSTVKKDGVEFLRQWFKDHRETYKIKP